MIERIYTISCPELHLKYIVTIINIQKCLLYSLSYYYTYPEMAKKKAPKKVRRRGTR